MHGLRLGTVFAIIVMCHKISADDLLVSSQGNTTPYMKGAMRYDSVRCQMRAVTLNNI